MYADHPDDYSNVVPSCYFSIVVPSSSSHFSIKTPDITPVSEYSPHTFAEPTNPLLAIRPVPASPLELMSKSGDASRLLQLQTAAAHQVHRPAAEPLQPRGSSGSSSSSSTSSNSSSRSSSATSPSTICCCRCRRESLIGMIQFGTNIHYCSHCARMVGYSAG